MKKHNKNSIGLQLNATGFESFAVTGWLGNRPAEVAQANRTTDNESTRKNQEEISPNKGNKPFRVV